MVPGAAMRADARLTPVQQQLADHLARGTGRLYADPKQVADMFSADRPLNEAERVLIARWIEQVATDPAMRPYTWSSDAYGHGRHPRCYVPMARHLAGHALAEAIGSVTDATRRRIRTLENVQRMTWSARRAKRARGREEQLVAEVKDARHPFVELRHAHTYTALSEALGPWAAKPNEELFQRLVAAAFDEGGRRALTEAYAEGFDDAPALLGLRGDAPATKAFEQARARTLLPDVDPREILPPGELYMMMRAIEVDRANEEEVMTDYLVRRDRGEEATSAMTNAICAALTEEDMDVRLNRLDEFTARISIDLPRPPRVARYLALGEDDGSGPARHPRTIEPIGDLEYDAWLRDVADRHDAPLPLMFQVDDAEALDVLSSGGAARDALLIARERQAHGAHHEKARPVTQVTIDIDSRTADVGRISEALDRLREEASLHNAAVAQARTDALLARRAAALDALVQSPKTRSQVAADLEQRHPTPIALDAAGLIDLLSE